MIKHGTLGTEVTLFVAGAENPEAHTGCSQPVGPGLVYGGFTVIEGTAEMAACCLL